MTTEIIKNNTLIATLPLQGNLQLVRELMGKNEIQVDVDLLGVLLSPIGSHILIKNKQYTVNTPPLKVEKLGNRHYNYSLMFESVLYKLYDKKLRHLGSRTFQFYGNLTRLAQLIVDNINEIDPGWTVGQCDDVPEKTIEFSGHTCRTALDTGAEAFGVEWENIDKEIRFTKSVGRTTSHVFKVGMGKGLYTLSYAYQNDKNIATRVYGYGSSRNLPEGFKGTELTLPEFYLDKNTALYGIKEGDYVNEDIYPQVNGVVSAAPAWVQDAATFTIQDSLLDFDLNVYFSTQTPKLSFKSGELQGQEFEIYKYNHATKTITLKTFEDGNKNTLPNSVFGAVVGDTYTLFDMFLPAERVQDAINRLRAATQEYINENSVPRVLYSMQLDPLYARDNNILLNPGDKVRIVDEALGIDELIRVTKVACPVEFPEVLNQGDTITVEIANFIPYTLTERVISEVIDTKNEVKTINRTNIERARRNAVNLRSLESSIFDTDGLFDSDKINVGVLSASLGIFGMKSQNFVLNGVYINDNYLGDPNTVNITTGRLNHLEYSNPGNLSEWILTGINQSALVPTSLYYVYAKCSRTSQDGTYVITTNKIAVEDVPGFYHFLMGVVYPVNGGYRDSEFSNGVADINGNRLKIGKIISQDGLNFFDLNNGNFNLGDLLSGLDWGITEDGQLTIKGKVNATDAEFVNLLVKNLRTGKVRINETNNNIRIVKPDTGEGEIDLIVLDDDSAIESVYNTGTPPMLDLEGNFPKNYIGSKVIGGTLRYFYAILGAGISVGVSPTHADGYSSIGRKEITTNGAIKAGDIDGTSNQSVMDKNGFRTTGAVIANEGVEGNSLKSLGAVKVMDGLSEKAGITVQHDVRVGGTAFYEMKWVNGVLVSSTLKP